MGLYSDYDDVELITLAVRPKEREGKRRESNAKSHHEIGYAKILGEKHGLS